MANYVTIKIENALRPDTMLEWFVLNYQNMDYPINTDDLLSKYLSELKFDYCVISDKFIQVNEGVQKCTVEYPKWYDVMADSVGYKFDNHQSVMLHFIYYIRRFN